jgi:hypothetical protein
MCPGPERLAKFWDGIADSPQLAAHPIKTIPNWKRRCIPLSFHGDGVPVTGVGKSWSRSMFMYSFSSMVGMGTTLQMMWMIWAVFKDALNTAANLDSITAYHVTSIYIKMI